MAEAAKKADKQPTAALVEAPEKPTVEALKPSYARIEKISNYVNLLCYYSGEAYGEFVLEEVTSLVQKGDEMTCSFKNSGQAVSFAVTKAEAEKIFQQWRSIKAQRRNAG